MRFSTIFSAEKRVNVLERAMKSPSLYAIRHKPTGRFLPRPPSGQKGGTWVEPTSDKIPRFFNKPSVARGFLSIWCKGPLVRAKSVDWETGLDEVDIKPDLTQAKEPRVKEDFEVVEIFWGVKK
jgi:hypothetical protein